MKPMFAMLLILSASPLFAAEPECVVAGDPKASFTVEEFADLQCPYCAKGSALAEEAARTYGGKVRVVFRHLPLSFHPQALPAAKALAAVCRIAPEKAPAFQAAVYANPKELALSGESFLLKTAEALHVKGVKEEMNGAAVEGDLARDAELAKRHGLTGTPSFLVGKQVVTGAVPFAELKKVIDQEL